MRPQTVGSRVAHVVATFAYCGHAPIAPGTVGAAAGLLLIVPLRMLGHPWVELAAAVGLFVIGA